MIETVKGNLITAFTNNEINFMVHCCNMQNVMGAGIAKQIRNAYPVAYEADTKWFDTKPERRDYSHMSLGQVSLNKYIANVYGQRYYGVQQKQLNEEFLIIGLAQLASITDADDTIGIPWNMGCGLAGGSWSIVYQIIQDTFTYHNVRIYKL